MLRNIEQFDQELNEGQRDGAKRLETSPDTLQKKWRIVVGLCQMRLVFCLAILFVIAAFFLVLLSPAFPVDMTKKSSCSDTPVLFQ